MNASSVATANFTITVDTTAPGLDSATAVSDPNEVEVTFSESLISLTDRGTFWALSQALLEEFWEL